MFKVFASIYSFLILFYFMSADFYSHSERRVLLGFMVIGAVVALFIGPSISKKKSKQQKVQVDIEPWKIGDEFHNDFSKVGSAEDYKDLERRNIIPLDLGADPIKSANAQLDKDLRAIGLDEHNTELPKKED